VEIFRARIGGFEMDTSVDLIGIEPMTSSMEQ
jgi:hypothetical protein